MLQIDLPRQLEFIQSQEKILRKNFLRVDINSYPGLKEALSGFCVDGVIHYLTPGCQVLTSGIRS